MAKRTPPPRPLPDAHVSKMAGDESPIPAFKASRKRADPPRPPRKQDSQTEAQLWAGRLSRANRVYAKWSKRYECSRLDEYYAGKHWSGLAEETAKKRYVINLIFATIETQKPALLFDKPKIEVKSRPSHEESAQSKAAERAELIQQTLQTFVDDPKLAFKFETTLALRDAFSRFAIVEVGYSADWVDNPNAGKPILRENGEPHTDPATKAPLVAPKKVLKHGTKESLYVRRLAPWATRVSPGHLNRLESNDWIATYEWQQLEDVKANTAYQHTDDLHASGSLSVDQDEQNADSDDDQRRVGMVKIWRIWDLRKKVRHVLAEGHKEMLQQDVPYVTTGLSVLKFYELGDSFYPLPPVYNWLGPQDEINDIRHSQKVHRRRALRRYMHEANITATELEKLQSDEDMVSIAVPKVSPPPIVPIQDAPLDPQNWTDLSATRDDLNQITGVSGESRNSPQSPTATQANIVNQHAAARESELRTLVAAWLASIARSMLLVVREKMTLPFMIKRTVDPFAIVANQAQVQQRATDWQQISAESLDDLDVDIDVDVNSLSPIAQETQKQNWNAVMASLMNPQLVTLLMTPNPAAPNDPSPMLREHLTVNGITSDAKIREFWRVGQAIMAQAAQSAQSQAALAKQPEPMKLSLALKGEDLANPIVLQILQREEGLPPQAAAMASPSNPLEQGGGGPSPSGTPASPASLPTGMPAPTGTGA